MAKLDLTGKIIEGKRGVLYTIIETGPAECVLVPLNGGKNTIATNPPSTRIEPEEPPVTMPSVVLLDQVVMGRLKVVGRVSITSADPAVI